MTVHCNWCLCTANRRQAHSLPLQPPGCHATPANRMRYISSMQHREDFRFSAELADATFSVFYVLISVVGYSKLGPNFDHSKPITSVLPWDWWTVAINTALLIRCLVAYVLNANVFSDLFCRLGRPWLSKLEDASPRMGRRASWALVSCSCVIMR